MFESFTASLSTAIRASSAGTDSWRKIIVWSKTGLSVFTLRSVFWRAGISDDGNVSDATTTGSAVPFSMSTGLSSRASITWTMIW